jgi:hypothetical protein
MLKNGTVKANIYRTTVRFAITAYMVPPCSKDFSLEYWQFIFGTKANRKRYGDNVIKSVLEHAKRLGLRHVCTNDFSNIDDDTMEYPGASAITTYTMMDLTKLEDTNGQ